MFALTEATVSIRSDNYFLYEKVCVCFFSSLYSGWSIDCFQREIAHAERGREDKAGRQTQRGHALQACHSLLSLYHLCDSYKLWMKL